MLEYPKFLILNLTIYIKIDYLHMTKFILQLLSIIIIVTTYNAQIILAESKMKTPKAKKVPHSVTYHGVEIEDEYSWMRDKDWPKHVSDKEILDYLKSENQYFNHWLQPLQSKKDEIFNELKGRIKLADQSTYVKRDNYYYYSRTEENADYQIYCRKSGSTDAAEEILLNVNELAKDKAFTSLGAFTVSPDHKLMLYSVDHTGKEEYTVKVYDLEKKEYLSDKITGISAGAMWHEKLNGFFYSPLDKNLRRMKVYFHKLGTDQKSDQLIFHETNELYSVDFSKASSREYIFINVQGHENNEVYYIDMQNSSFNTHLIKPKEGKILYDIDHNGQYFYIHTNEDAEDFHIFKATKDSVHDKSSWEDYIPEIKGEYLDSFDITKNYLILNYQKLGLPKSIVRDITSDKEKHIKFPDNAFTATTYSTNFDEDDIRVNYSSLKRPTTVYQYDFTNEKLSTLKTQEIPSGFNPDQYEVERLFVKTDGVEVPITVLYKKSLFKGDGSNPAFLYGYGSYGIAMMPSFRSSVLSYVDRGFIFAIAHIRGGSDLGYNWYETAKYLNKKRTFNDFIASAEYLIDQNYTSKGNIVISGGSAGGLLIGNVINRRPELYKAAIAHVPFVDVLNSMLDESLPLTPGEFKEWGNPKEEKYFHYMLSYSPYDNVKAQNYPALFVTAGLSDPRVGYWEASKWVARIRDRKTDNNLLLLKTNMSFGHSGASGRFDYLKEIAKDIVFVLSVFE